jgi:hypothetical protein
MNRYSEKQIYAYNEKQINTDKNKYIVHTKQIQSWSDIQTSSVIKPSILPITGHAIAIRYPDFGPYRVAIYVRISAFSGYRTFTVNTRVHRFKSV